MNESEIIATLNLITLRINESVPLILIIAGTFGHICNIMIFSKRSQRRNTISVYFLSSTIVCLIVLYFGVLIRYLQDVYNINTVNTSNTLCRVRSFLFYAPLSLSNWYILLGTIDRYLISCANHHRRQLSSIRNAYRSIGLITIICLLSYIHIVILYNIQTFANTNNQLQNFCYPQRGPYRVFSDTQLLVQYSLLPPLLMIVFVIFIIKNIHASHRRIANIVDAHHHARIKKRDLQLSKMLLVQVLITIICSLPLAVSQLLQTLTLTTSKSLLRMTIESFFALIARQLAFLNCSISFYLYTLSGSQFRLEIREIGNKITMFICHKRLLEKRQIGIQDAAPALNDQRVPQRIRARTRTHLKASGEASRNTENQV